MPTRNRLIVATVLLTTTALAGTANFDDARPGAAPDGWMATQTGRGTAQWSVVSDATAPSPPNVLKQSGVAAYPVCLKNDTRLQAGFVEVKFKAVSGTDDQAAGLVWRAQVADNYYLARANAREDNVCLYCMMQGKRTEKKRVERKIASGEWHTLRVDFRENHFTITVNGSTILEWDDSTFPAAGMVGVWTKADSVTLFDDFSYGGK